MARLSKNKLKTIVKECLVEILEEGLSTSVGTPTMQSQQASAFKTKNTDIIGEAVSQRQNRSMRRTASDNISYAQKTDDTGNSRFSTAIENAVSTVTDDPIMSSIFSDTARTTLQEQYSRDSQQGPSVMMQGDNAAKVAHQSDPTELFGQASQNWATLAFSDKKNK